MPGESEVANGQVPQLQVQNEDNETVIIQNGGPKKVETEKTEIQTTETQNDQKCQLKKVENENQPNESVGEQEKEVEKVEPESAQSESEQCQLKQVESESVQPESEQCQLKQVEPEDSRPAEMCQLKQIEPEAVTDPEQCQLKQGEQESQPSEPEQENSQQCEIKKLENEETEELTCPLRSAPQVEEIETETENPQTKTENIQYEADNVQLCELKKVEQDDDVPSCPIVVSTRVEEPKEELVVNGQQNQEIVQNGSPKKVSMFTTLDSDAVKAAYEDVRSDGSETQWAVFKFQGSKIALSATGSEFEKFREQFTENERGFGYIRIQTGDEMSKRQKFLFVTWIGPGVSVIQRAKMSTDKSLIKSIISNFAVELQLENESDFDLKHFVTELNKAGGANYGTGIRD